MGAKKNTTNTIQTLPFTTKRHLLLSSFYPIFCFETSNSNKGKGAGLPGEIIGIFHLVGG